MIERMDTPHGRRVRITDQRWNRSLEAGLALGGQAYVDIFTPAGRESFWMSPEEGKALGEALLGEPSRALRIGWFDEQGREATEPRLIETLEAHWDPMKAEDPRYCIVVPEPVRIREMYKPDGISDGFLERRYRPRIVKAAE